MFNDKQRVPTYFGKCFSSPQTPGWDHGNDTSFRQYFINETNRPVTVIHRSGLRLLIESKFGVYTNRFIIRTEVRLGAKVKVNVKDILNRIDEKDSASLKAIREAAQPCFGPTQQYTNSWFTYDEVIEEGQLLNHGGTVYLHQSDTVVSFKPPALAPNHPFSGAGVVDQIETSSPIDLQKKAFSYQIEIVDNAGRKNDRWVNINNSIMKVPVCKDDQRRDGIYISSNWHCVDGNYESGLKVDFYEMDDIDKPELGLFRSHEDAVIHGDIESARKIEIRKLDHSLAINKGLFEQEKLELQRTLQARDAEIKERDHKYSMLEKDYNAKIAQIEFDRKIHESNLARLHSLEKSMLEMRSIDRKERYDDRKERADVRKESTDTMKMLPAVVVALGGIILAIKSFL